MKRRRIRELISVFIAKKPGHAILLSILFFNIFFWGVSALVISHLAPDSLKNHGFWASVFYTISMILDAGCIQFVVEDLGKAGGILVISCLLIVLIGMISFTGAVIGYVTNSISNFIDGANSGIRKLDVSRHTVILNWNSRASEIVNDMLYSEKKEKIVVLVSEHTDVVEKEIHNRIADTLAREGRLLIEECEYKGFLKRWVYLHRNRLRNNLTIVVRQGDTYSQKQLNDISLEKAKTIIILGKDIANSMCKFDYKERIERFEKGNADTIKTLIQVADIASGIDSAEHQRIVVEVEDDWTLSLVEKIIKYKRQNGKGKCNIVPVSVNRVLGQILAQFSIMPELNTVYSDLLSNKGAEFFYRESNSEEDEEKKQKEYLEQHHFAIPVTTMKTENGVFDYFIAEHEKDIVREKGETISPMKVSLNQQFWLEQRNIIILGHNSKLTELMDAFNKFRGEWNYDKQKKYNKEKSGEDILNILVIDDKKSLDKMNNYQDYPYVRCANVEDIYDREEIDKEINRFIDQNKGKDVSILILSDDEVVAEDLDSNAFTYLVYVQDILHSREMEGSQSEKGRIDIIVETLNPKNYDVIHSYSVNNVIISNRYISKMITQIGEKDALFELYSDLLTYDEENANAFESKELYVKKVGRFFEKGSIPGKCSPAELMRAVFEASPDTMKAIVIGYVNGEGKTVLFTGDQTKGEIQLKEKDKLILFSCH
ncbi:MAG: hypothetical protein K6G85_05190 [Eubacterium sp.]|nr:hypothetical protein [Eubacterium sp.]